MSLQLAAQHLASRGRGPDTELVHMAPSEVAGLHALARAHGGELTINPDTGLPEAGFLSKLLPSIIGAGLTFFSGGALSPLAAAMITGTGYGLAKGNLQEGLMAGLGAFGGAGLGAGLSAAAGAAAPSAATALTAPAEGLASVGGASMENAAANAMNTAGAGGVGSTLAGLDTGVSGLGGVTAPTSGGLGLTAPAGSGLGFQAAPQVGLSGAPLGGAAVDMAATSPAAVTPGASYSLASQPLATNYAGASTPGMFDRLGQGVEALGTEKGRDAFLGQAATKTTEATGVGGYSGLAKSGIAALAPALLAQPQTSALPEAKGSGPNPYRYRFVRGEADPFPTASPTGIGRLYFPNARYEAYAEGGPVEAMSDANAIGANTGFPMADIHHGAYATPFQQPISSNVVSGVNDTPVDPYTGEERFAAGGISHLGDYSDGGRLLKGPGDGVSDSIPATIGDKRPARLADGEFVVPARIVSELGNGSTDAGARKLYAMMDRVQKARGKTTGKDRVAVDSRADKLLPV